MILQNAPLKKWISVLLPPHYKKKSAQTVEKLQNYYDTQVKSLNFMMCNNRHSHLGLAQSNYSLLLMPCDQHYWRNTGKITFPQAILAVTTEARKSGFFLHMHSSKQATNMHLLGFDILIHI